ncbi:FG-GAP-like repeat-containing protein [Streptomyces sp. NPDC021224]|uniref:FG-GAP-like repeat-containing protein n=1 Tax=unclassified Streptomyces TaxID=2593676 RepID=UPI00378F9DE7
MRFSVRAFITAAAVGAGLLTAAGPAHAATGYDRCTWGQFCAFDGARGTGAMTVITGDRATLGSWDNRITSIANYTDSGVCLYSEPNYQWWEGDQTLLYDGTYSLDESPTPQLDNAISSLEFSENGSDCSTDRFATYWGSVQEKRPAGLPAAAQFGDLDNDGYADQMSRNEDGLLYFEPGQSLAPQRIGGGWNAMTKLLRHGDYNGDSLEDVFARDSTGVLWFYPGNGKGSLAARTRVGAGWNSMRQMAATGDLNGDGRRDLVAADTAGALWLYPGNGKGLFGTRVKIGTSGWNAMNALVGAGDLNGDSRSDLLARDTAGRLWLYPGNGKGAFGARTLIGKSGWNAMQEIYGAGDVDGDGRSDIVAHDTVNDVWVYRGTGAGTLKGQVYGGWARDAQYVF